MTREQLEHVIRAAGAITGAPEIVVIGSQAVLGSLPDPPRELTVSIEADLFTFRGPSDAELIEGSIGELSPFHRTFGYYAHGVGPETATLPQGWRERCVRVQSSATGGTAALCPELHDLVVSKVVAGRAKDLAFVGVLMREGLLKPEIVDARLALAGLASEELAVARGRWARVRASV